MSDHSNVLSSLIQAHPALETCRQDILTALDILESGYRGGGRLLVCGNGGSAADAGHITGELMKGFRLKRPLPPEEKEKLALLPGGADLADKLQGALPCISLAEHAALSTAFSNDVDPHLGFAQQVWGYGREGDMLLCISTSGNAENVCSAAVAARARGMRVIGLTGRSGGRLKELCDAVIRVPADETYRVQEYHLPVYHALCAMLEDAFFAV